jgi:hypothetical protein
MYQGLQGHQIPVNANYKANGSVTIMKTNRAAS